MMTLALTTRFQTVGTTVGSNFGRWLFLTVGITVGYYLLLMAALVVKFGSLPNYVTAYNWPASVWTIIRSTPSFSDVPPIVAEEYLLEFGYMNYDYGHGISEWALNILPYKVILMVILAGLLAANLLLLRQPNSCAAGTKLRAGAASGLGTGFVALTSATMSWVVCCATPTWIVGLSMLGLGTSTAFWIEPAGPWLSAAGYLLLAISALVLAGPSETRTAASKTPAGGCKTLSRKGAHA